MQTELEFIQQFQDIGTTGTYEYFQKRKDGSVYKCSSISYVNGQKQGLQEKFHQNGHLKSRDFILPNGFTKKLLKYPNKNKLQDYETWTYPNEEDAGTFEYRSFTNGVLKAISPYVNHKLHGLQKRYSPKQWWFLLYDKGRVITNFYTQPVQLDQIVMCTVCFATPNEMVEPIALTCHATHTFCLDCLKLELKKSNRTCYVCKQPIEPKNFEYLTKKNNQHLDESSDSE